MVLGCCTLGCFFLCVRVVCLIAFIVEHCCHTWFVCWFWYCACCLDFWRLSAMVCFVDSSFVVIFLVTFVIELRVMCVVWLCLLYLVVTLLVLCCFVFIAVGDDCDTWLIVFMGCCCLWIDLLGFCGYFLWLVCLDLGFVFYFMVYCLFILTYNAFPWVGG